MKNISLLVFFFLFLQNVYGIRFFISYFYNGLDYFQISLNDTSIKTASLKLNDQDITSLCSYLSSEMYHCPNIPIADYIKSGEFQATYEDWTYKSNYYFSPQISQVVYPSGNRLPTTGGVVTINGRYFDKTTFKGTSNNLQLFYRAVEITDYTWVDRTQIVLNVPPGTGGAGSTNFNNIIRVSSYNTNSVLTAMISYQYPATEKNIEFDDQTNMMTISGSDFGNQPNLVTVYACGHPINNIQMITPHTKVSAFYNPVVFNNLSCNKVFLGVDGLNSTYLAGEYSILSMKPRIISISTPPVQGGIVEIIGNYLSNQLVNDIDRQWRIYINGVEYTTCTLIDTWRLLCNAPAGTFNSILPVRLRVVNDVYSDVFNAVYAEQTISSISKLHYTQGGTITISGSNFFAGSLSITVGETPCISPKYIDTNTVSCYFSATVPPNPNGLTVSIYSINGQINVPGAFQYFPAFPQNKYLKNN
ncbi:hypothetical protein DICPUDRAFT_79859 [Dictyostelium purpureum]|uniref:IPT/TIG domain-containing protein n=1 Tax=Dictyostelium purpureum TaxID=5786 RepID=F0ZNU7_DICPU|nr:uncharacterized protein DICPUDRAFT_79859 [Dictyostelium purpureum]EGC34355.1 hypothetical protein DICPUDRAFT_79859 [Dictyostelium purpureum]|eukprot:XP_003289089.1 hypothetical protein DICPUDRAFT_79859 [Dictyostelium purpureum]